MTAAVPAPAARRVLFVCTANLCRSPFLEHYARARLRPDLLGTVEVASAGTHAAPGGRADPEIVEALAGRGIDGTSHASRRVDRDVLDWADLVITADAGHRGWILADVPGRFARVWTLGQLHAALERVEGTGPEALAAAVETRGPTGPTTDVVDPFGQGSAAVAAAVVLMSEWLDPVLVRLGLATAPPLDHES